MPVTRRQLAIEPVVDIGRNGYEPPLDFTFMCLTSALDCLDEDPRERNLDISRKSKKEPFQPEQGKKSRIREKRKTNAVRLSNNVITEWTEFSATISKLVANPIDIQWIDVSFNDLTTIDKCLLDYPNLKVLYLHGNGIEKTSEVDKLFPLKKLTSLTLHGNPIEDQIGYRQYVLSKIPQLRTFDFSAVTKSDRACAGGLKSTQKVKRKQDQI